MRYTAFILLILFAFTIGFLKSNASTVDFSQEIQSGESLSEILNAGPTYARSIVSAEDMMPPEVFNFRATDEQEDSVVMKWETSEDAYCRLTWWENTEVTSGHQGMYEEAFINTAHIVRLEDLKPSSEYMAMMSCTDISGNTSTLWTTTFATTTPALDITPPAEATDVVATLEDGVVELRWQIPADNDFARVRIARSVRSDDGATYSENREVYIGADTSFVDRGIVAGSWYRYTLTTEDSAGNMSGGIVLVVRTTTPPEEELPRVIAGQTLFPYPGVEFWQRNVGILIQANANTFIIAPNYPVVLTVKDNALPDGVSQITLTIQGKNTVYAFPLQYNKKYGMYLVTLTSNVFTENRYAAALHFTAKDSGSIDVAIGDIMMAEQDDTCALRQCVTAVRQRMPRFIESLLSSLLNIARELRSLFR